MLKSMRSKSPIMVHLIFWPVIAVFVAWGFERYGNPVGGAAAVVNDHTITLQQYNNTLHQLTNMFSKYMGGNMDENMEKQFGLKQRAIQQLIGMELIAEQAQKMGFQVTDSEVRDQIINNPYWQKDGRFSKEYYDYFLHEQHMSPAQFEIEMKKDILRQKADKLFESQLRPSQLEVEKEKALRSVKMNVAFLSVDKTALAEKMKVPQSEVQAYLQRHEGDVKKYYELHQSEFTKPEEVKARHILVKAAKGNADQEKSAKEKIAKIQEELKSKPFEEVAKKYTDDTGTKEKGGDLGWFGRESKVREFSDAAFSQEVGKVGQPVQTIFGYHLIKVEGKHPAVTQAYDEVKNTIAEKLVAQEKIDKTVADAEAKMATAPQEALKELEGLDKSVKWQETGMFTSADETIPKIGENEDLAAAAMSLSEQKPVYPKLIKSGNAVYAVKLVKEEHVPAPDTTKVADEIQKDYGQTIFGTWVGTLRSQAKVSINNQLVASEDVGE